MGNGLVTLDLATAAATAAAFAEDSASRSSALGTNTGAEADILVDLGSGVAEVWAERRLGASDILAEGGYGYRRLGERVYKRLRKVWVVVGTVDSKFKIVESGIKIQVAQ